MDPTTGIKHGRRGGVVKGNVYDVRSVRNGSRSICQGGKVTTRIIRLVAPLVLGVKSGDEVGVSSAAARRVLSLL